MSQNPPDNPFGSQPPDNPFGGPPAGDPFGSSPPPGASPASDDAWRTSNQPQGSYSGPPIGPGGAAKAEGATASLVLGILGVVLCQLCAPFAWFMGKKAERLVDASGGRLAGRGEATAGKILGIIGTVFLAFYVVVLVLVFVAGVSFLTLG